MDDDIHHSKKNLETALRRVKPLRHGDRAIEFLQHLQASGLSPVRVLKYATTMTRILDSIDVDTAGRKEIEAFVLELNRENYKAWTKHGYKMTVKKLFQYLRYGNVSRDTPFPPEVAWIKTRVTEVEMEKESRISSDVLLGDEEIVSILRAARNSRDEAMLSVLFESAFRPGELLSLKVGSVQFLQDYCVASARGKTGQKRMPLIVSHKALLRWMSEHPLRSRPEAPLWCALDTGHVGHGLTYQHFRKIVRDTAARAGVTKSIWPYLFRHSQLTRMADKLTESKLTLFGGWRMGTKMTARYVHWSGRDLEPSLLSIYGLAAPQGQAESSVVFQTVDCPRCNARNNPASPRCESCGFILDKKLALETEDDIAKRIANVEELVRGALSGGTAAPGSR